MSVWSDNTGGSATGFTANIWMSKIIGLNQSYNNNKWKSIIQNLHCESELIINSSVGMFFC